MNIQRSAFGALLLASILPMGASAQDEQPWIVHTGASAQDEQPFPERCFNAADYQTYKQAFDAYQTRPGDDERAGLDRALKKRKPVKIHMKQDQPAAGATITVDASATTVPSGKPIFVWGNSANPTAESAVKTFPSRASGTYFNVTLKVIDSVCRVEASERITITSK